MYADADDVSQLLKQLGEVEQEGENWLLTLEGGAQLSFELDTVHDALAMCADLGQAPDHRRLAVCELLMTYTSLMPSTGGIAMAVAEPGGNFQQTCLLPLECVTADTMRMIVIDFAERAQLWREVVAQGASDVATPFSDPMLASAWARA